jgi:ADP-ribose pyrophosphatase YjhB (NUDIX family)
MEYLNLYDEQGNLLEEKGIRGQKNQHRVGIVHLFIENSKGEFLIQKTSKDRDSIYATTGGHVTYGSTFEEAVINEAKEELGIDITIDELKEVNTFIREKVVQKVFHLKKDINIEDIVMQPEEVAAVKWVTVPELENMIQAEETPQSLKIYFNFLKDLIG